MKRVDGAGFSGCFRTANGIIWVDDRFVPVEVFVESCVDVEDPNAGTGGIPNNPLGEEPILKRSLKFRYKYK